MLVVDTSADYIDFLNRRHPKRAVFLTDPAERLRCRLEPPGAKDELVVPMDDAWTVLEEVGAHLGRYGLRVNGVACFDCESMYLASVVARELGLPYPSSESVLACRSKFISKKRWERVGLTCPACEQVTETEGAENFRRRHGGVVVLKPLCGSGSELVFLCRSREACEDAVTTMRRRLNARGSSRRRASFEARGRETDPRRVFLAEQYCEGIEYSCDFFVDGDCVQVIRIARKYLKPDPAPGIAMAYRVPGELPASIGTDCFKATLLRAAKALQIDRALCMLDFLVAGDLLVLLEMAPRPGGDCLPQLLRASSGLDILGLELDVAQSRPICTPEADRWDALVGLKLFAPRAGTIEAVDAEALVDDSRVESVSLDCGPGHLVSLPPEDYHSRVLGHAIFRPHSEETIETECLELLDRLLVHYREEKRA